MGGEGREGEGIGKESQKEPDHNTWLEQKSKTQGVTALSRRACLAALVSNHITP